MEIVTVPFKVGGQKENVVGNGDWPMAGGYESRRTPSLDRPTCPGVSLAYESHVNPNPAVDRAAG